MSNSTAHRSAARGFTLIELLVVVAVIAILIGVLLPALGKARATGWQLVGAANQRQLVTGMTSSMASNDGMIPGINSTGLYIAKGTQTGDLDPEKLGRNSELPVQTLDWMTPALEGDDLPLNREQRFYTLLSLLADPALNLEYGVYIGGGPGNPQMAEYLNEYHRGVAPATSYLMPLAFQMYGKGVSRREGRRFFTERYGQDTTWSLTANQCRIPSSYIPRLDRIGNTALKIAVADGLRYVEGDDPGIRDFDASYLAIWYGSFCSSGAIYAGSTSYGTENASWEFVYPLVYRHEGKINAAHWDGHVETYSLLESQDPTLWYPSGSVFTNGADTVLAAQSYYDTGDKLR